MPLIEEITSDTTTEGPSSTSTKVQIEVVDNVPQQSGKGQ